MVTFYALEAKGRHFVLGFAVSCFMASGYAAMIGSVPFAGVEFLWGFVSLYRWYRLGDSGADSTV